MTKKKSFIPIIAVSVFAVVAVGLIAVFIMWFAVNNIQNPPLLEVKEGVTAMEYSTVAVGEFVINTENVGEVRIVDVRMSRSGKSAKELIQNGGQSMLTNDFSETYVVTVEAVGTYGKRVKKEVDLSLYQEPPEYQE